MTTPSIRSMATRRLPILVLVLVIVVSGLLLWRTLRDGRPAAEAGTVLVAADPVDGGKRFTVRVPGAAYDVTAQMRDDVPDDLDLRSLQAPEGGRFLGVSLASSAAVTPAPPIFATTNTAAPKQSATLIIDGRRHRLSGGVNSTTEVAPAAYWVAVAGGVRSMRLELTWDGRSQSLDLRTGARDAGDFAPLYRGDAGDAAETSCGSPVWTTGYRADVGVAAGCRFAADRLPYVGGKGWAPKGQQWLVVRVATTPPAGFVRRVGTRDIRYYGRSTSFLRGDESPRYRLDGRVPLASGQFDLFNGNNSRSDALLFSVSSGSSAHTATFVQRVQGYGRSTDSVVEVSQTWTVRL